MRTPEDEQKKELELAEKKMMNGFRFYFGFVIVYFLFLVAVTAYHFQTGQLYCASFDVIFGLFFIWLASGNVIMTAIAMNIPTDASSYNNYILEHQANKYLNLIEKLPVRRAPAKSVLFWHIANSKHQSGNYSEAENFLRLSIKDNKFPLRNYPHLLLRKIHLAGALSHQEKYDEVKETLNDCFVMLENIDAKIDKRPIESILNSHMTGMYLFRGEPGNAKPYAEEALKSVRSEVELPNWMYLGYWNSTKVGVFVQASRVYLDLEDKENAKIVINELVKLIEIDHNSISGNYLRALSGLASRLSESEEIELAERLIELAYQAGSKFPDHPHSIEVLDCYEQVLKLTNRDKDVQDMRKWILPNKGAI